MDSSARKKFYELLFGELIIVVLNLFAKDAWEVRDRMKSTH